jgi:hypothetical protein
VHEQHVRTTPAELHDVDGPPDVQSLVSYAHAIAPSVGTLRALEPERTIGGATPERYRWAMSDRPIAGGRERPETTAADVPLWRRAFDMAEHVASNRLENVMRTEVFAALLTETTMGSIAARRRVEAVLRRWLHLWNLPANSDVRHLHDLVITLDRRVRDLSRQLVELELAATRHADVGGGVRDSSSVRGGRRRSSSP